MATSEPWTAETSYSISVPQERLDRLQQKLALATWPDELDDSGWDYGVPLSAMKRLVSYWQNGFDWRKQEQTLNETLPQFRRGIDVDGFGMLQIHYVHQKSDVKNAIPLLFVHGWPGCFLEVRKILPLLLDGGPHHPSFHVVAIGLPGYGFSEAPKKRRFRLAQYAEVANKLMLSLGYNEYVTQGGDWGFAITRTIAQIYGPKHSKAWHTNYVLPPTPTFSSHPFTCLKVLALQYLFLWISAGQLDSENAKDTHHFETTGRGYFFIHATKPQTIGYSLADSPTGLLAWIYEKLVLWTDRGESQWTDDEVLTWVSIYLFSEAGPAASGRIYYETKDERVQKGSGPVTPFGTSYFPKEIFKHPRAWIKNIGNLVFESQNTAGGHFAALEQPEALAADVRRMFGKGGPAFGVVNGRTGYD